MKGSNQEIISELAEEFRPIFEASPDGVYLWLDEQHAVCNERLARMFGMTVEEWRRTESFLSHFIVEEDQGLFSWNYWHRVATEAFPVTFRFRGRRKDGSTFAAETDMIPISHGGRPVAYHFVREIAER